MTTAHLALAVAALSTGLFTGLLMTLFAFFHRALRDLSGPEFALVMRRFLSIVRKHPINYGLVGTSMVAAVVALLPLRGSDEGVAFALVFAGLVAFVTGPVLVSRFAAEPIYDVFLSWKAGSPPENWRAARDRYFRINQARLLGSAAAFVLFLAGLALL